MINRFTLFVLLLIAATTNPVIITAQVNVHDSLALIDLYNNTDGPHWTHNTNWLTSKSVISWYGISGYENNRVTELQLSANNLN